MFKQHTTQTCLNEQSFVLTHLQLKNIFTIKKYPTFANLLMEKPGIDLLHLVFYKQPVYKQLALAWQIAKQLSGLNPLSLSNNKNYSLKITIQNNNFSKCIIEAQVRIFLFPGIVIFCSQDTQVFVFLTIPRSTKFATS